MVTPAKAAWGALLTEDELRQNNPDQSQWVANVLLRASLVAVAPVRWDITREPWGGPVECHTRYEDADGLRWVVAPVDRGFVRRSETLTLVAYLGAHASWRRTVEGWRELEAAAQALRGEAKASVIWMVDLEKQPHDMAREALLRAAKENAP